MFESVEGRLLFSKTATLRWMWHARWIAICLALVVNTTPTPAQFSGTATRTSVRSVEEAPLPLPPLPQTDFPQTDQTPKNDSPSPSISVTETEGNANPPNTSLVSYESIIHDGQFDVPCESSVSCSCTESYTCPTCECCASGSGGVRPFRRNWFRAGLVNYWLSDARIPTLLTSGPAGGSFNQIGVLGANGTSILADAGTVAPSSALGFRMEAGMWLDPQGQLGIQTDLMTASHEPASFVQQATEDAPIARPFFNLDTGLQDSQVISAPGISEGSASFESDVDIFSSGIALTRNLSRNGDANFGSSTDAIAGYRYFGIDESFAAREVLRPASSSFVPGTQYELNDLVKTDNDFHGIELGARQRWNSARWICDLMATCALGQSTSRAALSGSTHQFVPGLLDSTVPGGFLVRPENIGVHRDRSFALLPQVRANVGYRLSNYLSLSAGYDFVYLSDTYRPGDFLSTTFRGSDLGVAPSNATQSLTPVNRSVILHGISLGLNGSF